LTTQIDQTSVTVTQGWLAGRIRPAYQFNPTRQIPRTIFSSTTFPTMDSSATALAAAYLLLICLPQQHY